MNSVFIQIDENPNCAPVDGQVFQPRAEPRPVRQVRMLRQGEEHWCEIAGLEQGGRECEALSYLVDDSGDGACFLIAGGAWGLRLRDPADGSHWGEPYLLLAANEADLRFSA